MSHVVQFSSCNTAQLYLIFLVYLNKLLINNPRTVGTLFRPTKILNIKETNR